MAEPQVTWRVRPIGRIFAGLLAAFMGFGTVVVVISQFRGRINILMLMGLIEFPGMAFLLWRGGVFGSITLTEQEVVIRNPIRTYYVPLSDITCADPGYYGITIMTRSSGTSAHGRSRNRIFGADGTSVLTASRTR